MRVKISEIEFVILPSSKLQQPPPPFPLLRVPIQIPLNRDNRPLVVPITSLVHLYSSSLDKAQLIMGHAMPLLYSMPTAVL